jgi:hypothetical protein
VPRLSRLPRLLAGLAGALLIPAASLALTSSAGADTLVTHHEFQVDCAQVGHAMDDPIVFPGQPGASHDHTFVGNISTNAYSTTASLLAATANSCLNPDDMSGYWFPTLFNGTTPVLPSGPQVIYYKSGILDYPSVKPFPQGLRFVVGSPTATQSDFQNAPGAVEGWECGDSYFNWDFPASCPAGTQLNVRYQAPSCWDGVHLDSADHRSHMAYPVNGVCPADHPVAVPMLEFKIAFPVSGDLSAVHLASGRGYTWHYDFINAWDPPTLAALVTHCIDGGLQCDSRGYDLYKPDRGAALDANYRLPQNEPTPLARSGWTATASATGGTDVPANALDGDPNTRWSTGAAMTPGQSFTVDTGGVRPVRQITIASGSGTDCPAAYQVLLSTDGINWGAPIATGPGTGPLLTIHWTPTNTRYIRVVQTGSSSAWWSVTEFNAYV